jgi:hypothetical protein
MEALRSCEGSDVAGPEGYPESPALRDQQLGQGREDLCKPCSRPEIWGCQDASDILHDMIVSIEDGKSSSRCHRCAATIFATVQGKIQLCLGGKANE